MTLIDELARSVGVQITTGEEWRNSYKRMKRLSQSKNNAQLWLNLVVKVKSDAVKSHIVWEPGMLGP